MPMTDAQNFGTKFGRRKPCLRYIGPLPGTTCVAPVGRGDHTPPPGCSARWGRHRSAPIPVGSQTLPTPCRGGPMCPPAPSSRDPPTGRHTGRPLQIRLQPPSTPGKPGGDRAPLLQSTNTQDRFEIYQASPTLSPTTQNTLHDRRHPAPILRPLSQRKKTPPSVSEQGFPKGGRSPPLVVSRRVLEGNRNPSQNFSLGLSRRPSPARRTAPYGRGIPSRPERDALT